MPLKIIFIHLVKFVDHDDHLFKYSTKVPVRLCQALRLGCASVPLPDVQEETSLVLLLS